MIAYLVSNNGKLNYESGLLIYKDYLGNITKFIPNKLSQIVVIGKLELTGTSINILLNHKIQVDFLYKNGKYNGKLVFEDSKNTFLRHKQHLIYEDEKKSLSIAKDIVRGKIHNQLLFAQRISRKIYKNDNILINLKLLSNCLSRVDHAYNLTTLRGIEGEAAKLYFFILGYNISPKWVSFNCRSKNPPLDEVNSVLSFIYTLLAIRIDSIILSNGLDDSVGTLHSLSYGRKSLIFDLIEEYRTPIADTLTSALFNLGTLKKEDFRVGEKYEDSEMSDNEKNQQYDNDIKKGVYLTESGMKKVVFAFEKKIKDEHYYPDLTKTIEYNRIFKEQVKLYKSVINGNRDHYLPLVVK
ncbi:MAG: CRISPR-associated endonuclease Cas1, partial [Pleomorphochaeta sp.]